MNTQTTNEDYHVAIFTNACASGDKLKDLLCKMISERKIFNEEQRGTMLKGSFIGFIEKETVLFNDLFESIDKFNESNLIKKGLIENTPRFNDNNDAFYYGKNEETALKNIQIQLDKLFKYAYITNGSQLKDHLRDFKKHWSTVGGSVLNSYCYMWTARSRLGKICNTHKRFKISNIFQEWVPVQDSSIIEAIFQKVLNTIGLSVEYDCGRLD